MRQLIAIPVYNEASHVQRVLAEVRQYASDILVVDDGSTDGTAELLHREKDLGVLTHPRIGAMAQRRFPPSTMRFVAITMCS